MGTHPDLQAEQAFIDRAYERLAAMRVAATELLESVLAQGKGGTHQARNERDVIVRTALTRLERLHLGDEALCFGRIDREDGETFHIGRLAVADANHEPLVVDWRAPVAEPFYRATPRQPLGLTRRRHFITEGRRLLGIEDEVFGPDWSAALDETSEGPGEAAVGGGALLAALERTRSGFMRDIVATVQREQDEIIRAELPGALVVQGGPGTGKTAVALHRAAYLLYTHRFPLERQGMLVVGPNPVFLRYIDRVLPSLGESGVVLTTVPGLVPDVQPTAVDPPDAARVKGDARIARVLARAVRDRERPLPTDVVVPFGSHRLRLTVAASAEIVASARRRRGTHNARRRYVESLVWRQLHEEHLAAVQRATRVGLRSRGGESDEATEVATDVTPEELAATLRRESAVMEALDRMWPRLSPQELLHDLFGAPALLALAGRGILSREEGTALYRPRSPKLSEVGWTPADVALIDEAQVALGPRRARPGDEEGTHTFGHIVVDEAQDLSPMQLRMLARRSLSGSMTVVGDIGQATGHWAPPGWPAVLAHLPSRRPERLIELSINYRTPAEIMDVAARVLAQAAPQLRPPRSVRRTGEHPSFAAVAHGSLAQEVAAVAGRLRDDARGGTVAVVCPGSLCPLLSEGLESAGVAFGEASKTGLGAPVTLVAVDLAKGLEFDAVVVAEPARIVREQPQGLRAVYVALTRATRRLAILHVEPLPAALVEPVPSASEQGAGPAEPG